MGDEKRPGTGRLKINSEQQVQELTDRDRGRLAAIRPDLPKDKLEVDEFCKIVRTLTDRDRAGKEEDLKYFVALYLFVLGISAIGILLLLGLGVIALPTALSAAVIGPVLSGVVGLLGLLVRSIFR